MNIMLTDIRSLTLEMTDIPVVEQGVGDSFPRLLQQQLASEADDAGQAIDLNKFFSSSWVSSAGSGLAGSGAPESSWHDYLSQHQMQVTVDSAPIMTATEMLGEIQPSDPLPVSASGGNMLEIPGQTLPTGGNILPETAVTPDVSRINTGQPEPLMPLGQASVSDGSVEPESSAVAVQPQPLPIFVEAPGRGSTDSVAAAIPITGQGTAAPVGAGLTREILATIRQVETPQAGRIQQTGSSTSNAPAAAGYPASLARSDNVGEPLPQPIMPAKETAGGLEIGARLSQEALVREASATRESVQAVVNPPRETQLNKGLAPTREVLPSADTTGAADTRDMLRNLATSARAPAESAMPEPATSRVPELPMQQAGNQSTQTVVAMSSGSYSPVQATPHGAPSITQIPLPSGLETMSLARGANAAEWGDGLSERVHWMINQKQNSATIRLDPPMLGKLDVQVRIADDATTITIQTQHAQTRDLIETASLRLRDALQENGFQNVNVDVSQRQDQQQARSQTASDEQTGLHDEFGRESESAIQDELDTRFFSGEGLLDTFA